MLLVQIDDYDDDIYIIPGKKYEISTFRGCSTLFFLAVN